MPYGSNTRFWMWKVIRWRCLAILDVIRSLLSKKHIMTSHIYFTKFWLAAVSFLHIIWWTKNIQPILFFFDLYPSLQNKNNKSMVSNYQMGLKNYKFGDWCGSIVYKTRLCKAGVGLGHMKECWAGLCTGAVLYEKATVELRLGPGTLTTEPRIGRTQIRPISRPLKPEDGSTVRSWIQQPKPTLLKP